MTKFLARLRVLLSAAPTYLVAAGAVLAILVEELAPYVDAHPALGWIVRVAGVAITVLAVATLIVRRVTPVLPEDRGLLPPPPPPAIVDAGRIRLDVIGALAAVVIVAVALLVAY